MWELQKARNIISALGKLLEESILCIDTAIFTFNKNCLKIESL